MTASTRQSGPVDKRRAELAAEREAEERAKREQQAREAQQLAQQKQVSDSWVAWTDQRIREHLAQWLKGDSGGRRNPLIDAMGEAPGAERAARRKEIKTAVEEARAAFETKLSAAEQRISSAWEILNERHKSTNALRERVFQENADQRQESRQAIEAIQQEIKEIKSAFDSKLVALEERLIAEARKESQHAVDRERVASDAKLEAYGRALSRHVEQATERTSGEFNAILVKFEEQLRGDVHKEAQHAVKETERIVEVERRASDARLETTAHAISRHCPQTIEESGACSTQNLKRRCST
jgi:hypothetical protein